ncbi:hypothetical protein [Amycolatopsis anabasis]|uniref:hypothetical protein n=1 Tax=Amycolatopsis anabasis TaxID=1840409 RepID=UPI00131C1F46|nr:hypothetical protein [Amycolatopsis anabasis]
MTDQANSARKWKCWSWRGRRTHAALVTGTGPIVDSAEVRRRVNELKLTGSPSVDDVARVVSQRTGREIRILPYPEHTINAYRAVGEEPPSGAWVPGDEMDFIFHRDDTTPEHQLRIILHELGHGLCRHVGDQPAITVLGENGPSREVIARAVQRHGRYDKPQEHAAELFAYLVARIAKPPHPGMDDDTDRYRLLED